MYRIDRTQITKVETLPNGALRLLGTIARVGELKYLNRDGSVRIEHLTADELFNEKWLDSLANAPLTLSHPTERVTPANWKKYAVGSVGGIPLPNQDAGTLDFVHIVNDEAAIAAVQSGTVQLSPGYDVDIRQDGDRLFQQNRVANHNAIVQVARGGDGCRLHMDSVTAEDVAIQILPSDEAINLDWHRARESSNRTDNGGTQMTAIAIGNRTYNVDGDDAPKLADAVASLLDQKTELEAEAQNLSAQNQQNVDALTARDEAIATKDGEIAGLKTKLDAAESSRMDGDAIKNAIASRMDVWGLVLPAVRQDSPDFEPDWNLDAIDIKRLWLLRQDESLKDDLNFKLDAFVEGLWKFNQPQVQEQVSHADGLHALVNLARGSSRDDARGGRRGSRMAADPTMDARKSRKLPGMVYGGSN